MKFVFGKRFNFEKYPNLLKCHNEYERLSDLAYDAEAAYEDGAGTKEAWGKALDEVDAYCNGAYAVEVYKTFIGKNLVLMDRKTKDKKPFDEMFSCDVKDLNLKQRKCLTNIVENDWGYKLPAEYYDKHKQLEL